MTTKFRLLAMAWGGLVALTLVSIMLGEKFSHASWTPLLVAAIIWIKGNIVARYFLDSHEAHPFIAWLLRVFILIAPIALVLTVWTRQ